MPRFANLEVVDQATKAAHGDGKRLMSEKSEAVDPSVVEHVVAIRDRFGVRGLRDAEALIQKEIKLAELALQALGAD